MPEPTPPGPTAPPSRSLRFEHRNAPLASQSHFYRRLFRNGLIGLGLLAAGLAVGMIGYHHFEHMGWLDAYLNAAMILSGMGPLASPQTTGGKLFAGAYAIFSGVAFLTTVGIFLAPVVHRFLHRFHLENRHEG
ncbi:MAG: hypothetical protein ACHQ5A_01400 [Opitutales bacterium]